MEESKSVLRLLHNLESDPGIQVLTQSEEVVQSRPLEDPRIEPLQKRVFQIVQDAMTAYSEQGGS